MVLRWSIVNAIHWCADWRELAAGNTDTPLTISADGKASHQAVITAMDAAGKAGFGHLNISTQQPEAGQQ